MHSSAYGTASSRGTGMSSPQDVQTAIGPFGQTFQCFLDSPQFVTPARIQVVNEFLRGHLDHLFVEFCTDGMFTFVKVPARATDARGQFGFELLQLFTLSLFESGHTFRPPMDLTMIPNQPPPGVDLNQAFEFRVHKT